MKKELKQEIEQNFNNNEIKKVNFEYYSNINKNVLTTEIYGFMNVFSH